MPLPLLRWAGSKKRQFAKISRFFPRSIKRYSEPFAGSAAFAFCLDLHEFCLNDLNTDVIDFYKQCSARPIAFYKQFSSLPRDRDAYYYFREIYNATPRCFERSVLFYYLNRNCFNGIYRLNKAGLFNVPFSDSRVSPYLSPDQFCAATDTLKKSRLHNSDFEDFCDTKLKKSDFVFIDPPYHSADRIFSEYTAAPFESKDFGRLLNVLGRLDRRGVRFLLSYPDGPLAKLAGENWRASKMPVLRTIASDPSKRRHIQEVLIYNYDRRSA